MCWYTDEWISSFPCAHSTLPPSLPPSLMRFHPLQMHGERSLSNRAGALAGFCHRNEYLDFNGGMTWSPLVSHCELPSFTTLFLTDTNSKKWHFTLSENGSARRQPGHVGGPAEAAPPRGPCGFESGPDAHPEREPVAAGASPPPQGPEIAVHNVPHVVSDHPVPVQLSQAAPSHAA